jgi:DNA-binding NarL/FixJ family response regulator
LTHFETSTDWTERFIRELTRDAASGAGAVGDPLVISHPERVRQLRALPPRLRQVQAMAREGFTVPETARALGISINTVKQYRALLLRRGGMP